MEALPTPPARNSRPMAVENLAGTSRAKLTSEGASDVEGQISSTGFSKLLKSAGQQDGEVPEQSELLGLTTGMQLGSGLQEVQQALQPPAADTSAMIAPLWGHAASVLTPMQNMPDYEQVLSQQEGAALSLLGSDMAWSLQSLVGQTTRLDQSADVSLRNGTHLQAKMVGGDLMALTQGVHTAALGVAAHVPVVAQGVLAAGGESVAQPIFQASTAMGVASLATDALQSAADGLGDDGSRGTGVELLDSTREGRHALQGQWTAAERPAQPAEVMQRLLGQMSQFLSATGALESAGVRRSGAKSADDAALTAQDIASLQTGAGLGAGRLMEQAVTQTAAAQQAHNGDTPATPAEPEVDYWMNARQQRAEVVLDRGGEPVRVQVMLEGNSAHITFRSDEHTTRSMLDASIAQLRDMLAAQGVELAGVQINSQTNDQTNSGQGNENGAEERFIPEGARRMRMAVQEPVQPGLASYQSRVSQQGIDIFA